MFDLIAGAYIIGQVIVGPNMIQTDYMNEDNKVVTVTEVIQEVPQ